MKTDRLLLTAGVLAALAALVHAALGTPAVQPPLLAAALPLPVKLLLLACWYMVAAALAVSAGAILWSARQPDRTRVRALLTVVGLTWVLFGLVIAAVGAGSLGTRGLLLMPQWVLLIPVGIMAWAGARRALPVPLATHAARAHST